MLDSGAKTSVTAIPGQSGAAMVRDYMGRSYGPWVSVFSAIDSRFIDAANAAGKAAPNPAPLEGGQAQRRTPAGGGGAA